MTVSPTGEIQSTSKEEVAAEREMASKRTGVSLSTAMLQLNAVGGWSREFIGLPGLPPTNGGPVGLERHRIVCI